MQSTGQSKAKSSKPYPLRQVNIVFLFTIDLTRVVSFSLLFNQNSPFKIRFAENVSRFYRDSEFCKKSFQSSLTSFIQNFSIKLDPAKKSRLSLEITSHHYNFINKISFGVSILQCFFVF